MSKSTINYLALLVLCLLIAIAVPSIAGQFRRVETSHVCMVNNADMGKPQIPVAVGDQTYYGCCKMCAGKLTNNRKVRFATDPVSGKEVDKAKAITGATPDGEVLYFESEENIEAFILQPKADR